MLTRSHGWNPIKTMWWRGEERRGEERGLTDVVWTLNGFCCQAEDKFKSSTGHCHSLSLVNFQIGKVFSLNSQENLQLRISPVVSSKGRQARLVGGWCLYHCFVCEFVVSFDRIIPHPREEGEDSQYSQGGAEVSRDYPAAPVMFWGCLSVRLTTRYNTIQYTERRWSTWSCSRSPVPRQAGKVGTASA